MEMKFPIQKKNVPGHILARKEQAGIVCNILHDLGVIERDGKKGNAYLYRVVEV